MSEGAVSFKISNRLKRSIVKVLMILLSIGVALGAAVPLEAQTNSNPPVYPLKVSSNHRYLTDQNGTPFMIVGDSPQGLITDLSVSEAADYFANRAALGFNAVQIHLVARSTFGGRNDASTYDGIIPFTNPGDLSTPNEAYFQRVDTMLNLAAQNNIVVFLTVAETIDSLAMFRFEGPVKSRAFGQYVGNRYKNFNNIVWDFGNDFQSWRTAEDNAVILAVALGVQQMDTRHLNTVWLDFFVSASRDSIDWDALIDLDLVYTYYPTYAKTLSEYALFPPKPIYMGESNYEEESIRGYLTTPEVVRRQEYWAMTSGATGSFYGSYWTWNFKSGWQDHYNSPGALQMKFYKSLFESRQWWKLVPDSSHQVLTGGLGTFDEFGSNEWNDYATAAMASDSSFMIAYLPSIRGVTVNMSKFSGPVTAKWFDPSNGTYLIIPGSPFSNSGTRQFTPPGNNGDGTGDWVLVIEHPRPRHDFSGEGKSDIVWKHTDGSSAIWLMNGLNPVSGAGLLGQGTNWSVQDSGDFNGDGKSDILWTNTDGSSAIWLMDGLSVIGGSGILGPTTVWSVSHIGDFNGDGKSDIVWRHTNGSSAIWLMNGLGVLSGGGLLGPTGWSVEQVGDFDGDGRSDVVWHHTNGSISMWLMNGLTPTSGAGLIGSGNTWIVKNIGDFNGDGKADFVFQNQDGSVAAWLMDGLTVSNGSGLQGNGTGWTLKDVADFDGDGKSDLVWQHADGRSAIWLMNGLATKDEGSLLGPNTGWSPAP